MKRQSEVLNEFLAALSVAQVRYLIGGSVASSSIGIPRATLDTDLLVDVDHAKLTSLGSQLGDEWYLDVEFASSAVSHHRAFNVIHMESGFKFDLFPAYNAFHRSELERAQVRSLKIDQMSIACPVATLEDMVLAKLQWYREGGEQSDRQWADVVGMLTTVKNPDYEYLGKWAQELGVQDLLQSAFTAAKDAD